MSILNLSTPEAAEAAFYAAFAQCDFKAMEAVWAEDNIVCIHPGSSVLMGRDAVMRSWANMLLNAEPPNIRINLLSRTLNDAVAVHVVEEHISSGFGDTASISLVLATNVYRKEADGWRMFEHHASVPRFQRTGMNATSHKHTLQ